MPSPIGELLLTGDEAGLTGLYMEGYDAGITVGARRGSDDPLLSRARRELEAYFAGRLTRFEVPLQLVGTAFQRRVWAGLLQIPFGATTSYGALATRLGQPTATRAVGLANGRNPVSIIVPCHRVIGRDGSLTGYGGGIARKRWLLAHEAAIATGSSGDRLSPLFE
jgi:methylated-DNA-[protein]-cysteine S-methyltransferase